jgi:hypothetical protein
MRRFALVGLVVLAVLAAGAYAFAGSSGGPEAFALVDPSPAPHFVAGHTSGFVALSSPAPGDYCLIPARGVNVVGTAAVASEEAFYSNVLGEPLVRYPATPETTNCGPGQLEVKTFDLNVDLNDQIAFSVLVP